MSKSLVNAIENLEDYVKKLETVVNIDSGTTDTQGVTKVAKQFVQWFSDIGFYAEEVSFDDVVGHGVLQQMIKMQSIMICYSQVTLIRYLLMVLQKKDHLNERLI